MNVKPSCHILFLALALALASVRVAHASPQITVAEAKKVALIRVPGTVVHEKLKHKKKGHDYYSIKIKPRDHATKGMVKKVEVDKETGQILKIKDVKAKDYDD